MQIKLISHSKNVIKNTQKSIFLFTNVPSQQGNLLGNLLRQTLLTQFNSLKVVGIRIPNVTSFYTTLPYLYESLLNFIQNLTKLSFKTSKSTDPLTYLSKLIFTGPLVLTGNLLQLRKPNVLQVFPTHQYLGTIVKEIHSYVEILIASTILKTHLFPQSFLKVIPNFSPVKDLFYTTKVNYNSYGKLQETLIFSLSTTLAQTPWSLLKQSFKYCLHLFYPLFNLCLQ